MPRRKIRRMTVEEPRVSDEALQCEPLDAVFHPVQCKGQPLANLESADRPGLVKALKAQNKEDLEGILTACDGADPSPAEAAIALRTAAKAAQRLSSPLRIMQARDRRVLSLIEALLLRPDDVPDAVTPAPRSAGLDSRSCAAALWSLAVFGGPVLFQAETDTLLKVIDFDALSADELTDVAWGLGAAHHYTDRLFDLEAGLMRVTPGRLRPLHAATALWAFARLDWVPSRMLAAIGSSWRLAGLKPPQGRRRVEPVLPNMTARQLGTCSWALAALQQTTTPCFEALWVELCSRGLEKLGLGTTLRTDTLMQIHQTHLSLRLDSSEISEQMTAAMKSPSGAALLEKSSKTWQELSRPVHGQRESSQQREIANTLSSLGHFHVVEDGTSGYTVDIGLPQQRVAIEADGPSHFTRNAGTVRALGHTAMKRRHLQRLGWTVVSIPWYTWDECRGAVQRRAYLEPRINSALEGSNASVPLRQIHAEK